VGIKNLAGSAVDAGGKAMNQSKARFMINLPCDS